MKRSLVCVALVTGSLVLASPTVAPAQHYCHGRSVDHDQAYAEMLDQIQLRQSLARPGVPLARAVRRGGDQPAEPT
jgi:hypothetical protein